MIFWLKSRSKALGRTLAEKILSNKSASDLKAGDIAIGIVDLIFIQDTRRTANYEKPRVFPDYAVPNPSRVLSNDLNLLHACSPLIEIVGS